LMGSGQAVTHHAELVGVAQDASATGGRDTWP
jgi:hypothetical protein